MDKPGYIRQHFLKAQQQTAAGPVPIVETLLQTKDHLGTIRARIGFGRDNYRVSPGLYGVGNPGPDSPVMVSANYKLSFDSLRQELSGFDVWILVLDTVGVNVWCSAGKGTFSTREIIHRIQSSGLKNVVNHRKLILPQLSATGVAAHAVKKGCGFRVVWGPIRAADIPLFIANKLKADEQMRHVTFTIKERAVLIPVEIGLLLKPAFQLLLALLVVSGIGPDIFSIQNMWSRGGLAVLTVIIGIIAGTVITPLLLPWIPGRSFSLKGIWIGILCGLGFIHVSIGIQLSYEVIAILLSTTALSSYLAMNFTGSTPFTSPSGVEKEMKRAIPVQAVTVVSALIVWILSAFSRLN